MLFNDAWSQKGHSASKDVCRRKKRDYTSKITCITPHIQILMEQYILHWIQKSAASGYLTFCVKLLLKSRGNRFLHYHTSLNQIQISVQKKVAHLAQYTSSTICSPWYLHLIWHYVQMGKEESFQTFCFHSAASTDKVSNLLATLLEWFHFPAANTFSSFIKSLDRHAVNDYGGWVLVAKRPKLLIHPGKLGSIKGGGWRK